MTKQIMLDEAKQSASFVSSIIAQYDGANRVTAALLAARYEDGTLSRAAIVGALRAKQEAMPESLSTWFMEEPKALDGSQVPNDSNLVTNNEGLFSPSYSRSDDGKLVLSTFERLVDAEWYRLPTESGKGALTNPFVYGVAVANPPLIAAIVYPVKAKGKLIGLTGTAVNLSGLSDVLQKVAPMGTGQVMILSKKGEWVVNPDKSLLAKGYGTGEGSTQLKEAVSANEARVLPAMSWSDGTRVQRVFLPFRVATFDTTWVAVVDVPLETINAPLQQQLIAMLAGLAAMILVIAGIAWAILYMVGRPIQRLASNMGVLANGDLSADVAGVDRQDEIGAMARAVQVFKVNGLRAVDVEREAVAIRSLAEKDRADAATLERNRSEDMAKATTGLAQGLQRLANGDLTYQLREPFAPDFESLRTDFNASIVQLRQTIQAVANATGSIDSGSRELSQGALDLSRRTEQQAASLEETAAALEEITANLSNSSKRADDARTVARQSNESAQRSGMVVGDAIAAMHRIQQSSNQISNIISVIDEIAFQTNLLALNAGVEAARAGEAGKGFAVVAQEVRELAQRSAKAAKEIKGLIQTSAGEVEGGVRLVAATGETLKVIEQHVVTINTQLDAIATAAKEQSIGLSEVNTAVNHMDQATQQNAAMVEQSTAASETLAAEAEKLRLLVDRFVLEPTSRNFAVINGRLTA
ncbi:methyl-accepting chemotaxis protein [Neorhizobium lilium]|uniref:Methyl-accepting chemotaxis protein n=2 Tax=Neorhizobium lilium TaxID=2503024 RepID=A0A444LB85_9HYPH|nr:methyl-accepting chemotaxis protein [Neorhizobium lilium]